MLRDEQGNVDSAALRGALPAEMVAAKRWLLYVLIKVPGEKDKKVPYYADGRPRAGTLDTPDDVERLVTFDDACAALSDRYAGLGFALGDGFQGIDLDDHFDSETGELSQGARWILQEVKSYAEV